MPATNQKYNTPVFKKNQPDDTNKFLPTPDPTGSYPYHLALGDIQPEVSKQKLVFHMLGDSGSIRNSDFLRHVSSQLVKQFEVSDKKEDEPQFLYHLGDIVYNHGEAQQYQKQFFEPFRDYPAPIVAIAGNHDSDVNPENLYPYHSLDAFKSVFCDIIPQTVTFSGNAKRKSMIQPGVYWTLETPLANIIGLHSNVPKYGIITQEQRSWLVEEFKKADKERPEKAILLCLHHAPYSADINHGSSIPMIQFLEGVYQESGARPDIVFSGHVHNYQRFIKKYSDGKETPYIVAGAGGYDELHPIAYLNDNNFHSASALFEGIKLDSYCDDQHGFLKITLERTENGLTLTGDYYITRPDPKDTGGTNMISYLADTFFLKIA